jgi:molybdopterin-biosynthesis enzyme MoeA-like protein
MSKQASSPAPRFGLIVVGDEILSGKREDKHMTKCIEILGQRGLSLSYAHYVGDEPQAIARQLKVAFESGDIVFSTGGIGATPDDHTRQCAALALEVELEMHEGAKALILERMRDMAVKQGTPYEPDAPDAIHRLNMAVFPMGAQIIPNPYNKIAGFSCRGVGQGAIHFVPGFPVMAWPMMEWVLDTYYSHWFNTVSRLERSVIVKGAMEATLTPLMQKIESDYPGVKVFSLPSVDHPEHGRHVELGVKGNPSLLSSAYADMIQGLESMQCSIGPELVRGE